MRTKILAAVLLVVSGAAAAGDELYGEARYYDSSVYAAQAFYRMSFGSGSEAAPRHVLGLRMDNERALHLGAPSLLKTEVDFSGNSKVLMNGLDLTGIAAAASQTEGGFKGWLSKLTASEIATITAAVVIVGLGVNAAIDDDDPTPSGTGTGGN